MKIILKRDVDDLGFEGDIVEVTNGYARNYLIPKDVAIEASKQNIKFMEMHSKKIEVKRLKAKEDAEKVKGELDGIVVTISQKAGEEEKLLEALDKL